MKEPNDKGGQSMTSSAGPNGLINTPQVKYAWASYIAKWITAYSDKGVPIWSVTPQNEPEFAAPWEACTYTADFESDFINHYLGPVLHARHPEVKILGFDHNKDHLLAWTETLMTKKGSKYVDGMAFHCELQAFIYPL
jgi:glucosylceramidase